ncbi:MAG: type II toxin-antitoxin system RelE/ParE family toxin [Gemmataceae bacterium]|nr:type II toxin-antitoxin system RelE/ParE family toxin [Gemmataceae bacterium]MCI0741359.1 type II toxin-antitoxin system RelE/ParE family toxin [Gemmataceae bacterium]
MRFIETPTFTRVLNELLDDDQYQALQLALLLRPEAGPLIRGGGGLRKLRWSVRAKGKRGGCRLVYYWDRTSESFYMLLLYRKNKQEDLTPAQLRVLRHLVREEFE